MAPRTWWTVGLLVGQTAALAATWGRAALGTAGWHHLASLAIVLVGAVLVRKHMGNRRFLGIGILVTTVLASASGFFLLYWKEGIRVDGYQDWALWWHVLWSWAAAVFFWQHTWVNRVVLGHFFRRSLRSVATLAAHVGAYGLVVAGFLLTAGPGKTWFDEESYIPISIWTWLASVLVAYLAWLLLRRRPRGTHTRIRGGVDLALVPAAAVATLSGLPLLWLGDVLDGAGRKYASKFWHVGPSILFSVLVYIHSVQLWRAVSRHWKAMGKGRTATRRNAVGSSPGP